ncbi:type VI secretion-associated protein [Motiliproteus sp. MSK22-1]|nr:type VI secretion-associated protein [Motiliproteus sp. MSK22-1]
MDAVTGFYGKLPSHGDFLVRRLNRNFTAPWDQWLQTAIADSQSQLGEQWLNTYLVSPIWRFSLSSGICGHSCWCGILMPSVDSVGRYFPLTIATPLPAESDISRLFSEQHDWFEQCEALALDALNGDIPLDHFDQSLCQLDPPSVPLNKTQLQGYQTPQPAWCFNLESPQQSTAKLSELALSLLADRLPARSYWCAQNAEQINSTLLITAGLPPSQGFSALLDGQWKAWGWGGEPYNGSDLDIEQ